MASNDDVEELKEQNFGEPIKHNDEVGPVGSLFESCVQILRSLSTKARELDAGSRKHHHPDGPQRSESDNDFSSTQSRKEGRFREMAKPGCMTCEKRQKKCDEGKPECNNCVRDGFICDGYIVKSTRPKPEAPNSNPSGQGTETFPKSGQPLPLDGAASQLLVKTLESNVATLLFWDDDFGALSGHLDKALEHSEENRDLTLATLISLADFLSHDLLNATLPFPAYRDDIRQKSNIHARVDKARGIIMDTETPDREETRSIQDVCEILDSKVDRLNVLGPILEESIPSGAVFEQVAAHSQLDDRPAHQYYADQISIRFPNASTSLVEVLGKCNWERYMRIHKKREENTQREGSPIGETENMSKFHDSGLGTSVPAQSVFGVPQGSFVYAETEVSKRAEASHRRLPPLPEEGRRGCGFVCDICNRIVNIRRTGAWKMHVFSDVLAYVCIFDDCPSDRCFFEDRDALTAHLGNQHGFAPAWNSAKCPLCLEETGDGRNATSLHFARHMEEVALGAIPRTADSDAGSAESSTAASFENGRRNSFELDDESREKGMCPVEGCGRVFRDLKAHMLTHIGEQASGPPEYTPPVMTGLPTPENFPTGSTDGPTPIKTIPANYSPATSPNLRDLAIPDSQASPDERLPRLQYPTSPNLRDLADPDSQTSPDERLPLLKDPGPPNRDSDADSPDQSLPSFRYLSEIAEQESQENESRASIDHRAMTPSLASKPTIAPPVGTSHDDLQQMNMQDVNEVWNDGLDQIESETWPFSEAMGQTPIGQQDDHSEVPFTDTRSVPRLGGNMTDIYADELFNPSALAPAAEQSAQSSNATKLPPFRNILTDRLQAAHQARSKLSEYSSHEMSSFEQKSPLAPPSGPSDTLSSAQMHQVAAKQSAQPDLSPSPTTRTGMDVMSNSQPAADLSRFPPASQFDLDMAKPFSQMPRQQPQLQPWSSESLRNMVNLEATPDATVFGPGYYLAGNPAQMPLVTEEQLRQSLSRKPSSTLTPAASLDMSAAFSTVQEGSSPIQNDMIFQHPLLVDKSLLQASSTADQYPFPDYVSSRRPDQLKTPERDAAEELHRCQPDAQ